MARGVPKVMVEERTAMKVGDSIAVSLPRSFIKKFGIIPGTKLGVVMNEYPTIVPYSKVKKMLRGMDGNTVPILW